MKKHTENAYSDSTFRFNGKEWEGRALRNRPVAYFSEGARLPRWRRNFYYGARYYDPKISVWLSVDPLAAKYPSLSPFNFVANNPLALIDPDGKQFKLAGDQRRAAFKQLRKAMKQNGIELSMNKETGVLSYKVTDPNANRSKAVSTFLNAIIDAKMDVTLTADSDLITDKGARHNGGAFLGAQYLKEPNGRESVVVNQEANPIFFSSLESASGESKGKNLLHEATEASIIGYEVLKQKKDAAPNGPIYRNAHTSATPHSNSIIINGYDSQGNQLPSYTDPSVYEFRYYTDDVYGNIIPVPFYTDLK